MITDEVLLPTSNRFLDGMEWLAKEDWMDRDNNPDSPEERMIFIITQMNDNRECFSRCYCIFPSKYYDVVNGKSFDLIRNHPDFEKLCERVKALIVTKPKEN